MIAIYFWGLQVSLSIFSFMSFRKEFWTWLPPQCYLGKAWRVCPKVILDKIKIIQFWEICWTWMTQRGSLLKNILPRELFNRYFLGVFRSRWAKHLQLNDFGLKIYNNFHVDSDYFALNFTKKAINCSQNELGLSCLKII